MTSAPRASVVITNHNYARYLRQAIDSVLAQRGPTFEVIVVDDGSTDGSAAILHDYGAAIVPVLKPNGGQASALNAGFARSRGAWLLFLDADDTLLPGALARVSPAFDDARVVKVHWPLCVIDEHGAASGEVYPPDPLADGDLVGLLLGDSPEHRYPPHSGNAWRRRFCREVLPLPERELWFGGADTYLSILAIAAGHVRAIGEPLGTYRIHARSHFQGAPFELRLARAVASERAARLALAAYCRERRIPCTPARWLEEAWYHRLQGLLDEVLAVVPPSARVLVADGAACGLPGRLRERRFRPLVAREGVDFGPPASDGAAIAATERGRAAGAAYLLVAWPAFWWLEHYGDWAAHLARRYARVLATPRAILYDLRRRPEARATRLTPPGDDAGPTGAPPRTRPRRAAPGRPRTAGPRSAGRSAGRRA